MGKTTNIRGSVLVVEDEADFAALLTTILQDGGYEVRVAEDGIDAVAMVHEQIPDLITLDLRMPRKTGILFFRELKSQPSYRDVPVIVVTGLTAGDRDMETFIHSFLDVDHLPMPDAYLEKPVRADELLLAVGNAIARGDRGSTSAP